MLDVARLMSEYKENGFTIVPAVIVDEADRFYKHLAQLIRSHVTDECSAGRLELCQIIMMELIEHRPDILHTIYESLKHSAATGRIVYHPSIVFIASLLLELHRDVDPYLSHHTCRIREPGDSYMNHRWHQESFYSIHGSHQVNLWVPLIRRSLMSMGTIGILKKSHHDGELPHCLESKSDGKDQFFIPEESLDATQYEETRIELSPGDALFFHPLLVHRGNPNESFFIRYCLTSAFVDPTDPNFRLTTPEEQKNWHRQRCQRS